MGRDVESDAGHPRRGRGNAVHPFSDADAAAPPMRQYAGARPFRSWMPWLVPAFIVANVAVFAVTMFVNDCPKNSTKCVAGFLGRFSFQPFKENPLLGPSSLTLQKMGALDVKRVVDRHQVWRVITCIWLHAGVFHILANMLCLIFIGIRLEQEFGFVRIGLLYIISGVGGSLMSALFIQSSISVGASGALFGLLGGMLSELITNWTIYANKFAALFSLLLIAAINLALGILPHVDNFAHIGGFLSGFLLGFVFLIRPQFGWISRRYVHSEYVTGEPKSKHKTYQYVLWIVAFILLVAGFIVGFVMVLRGVNGNDHCSWCHYLSCVPTSMWSCKTETSFSCMSSTIGNSLNLTCSDTGKYRIYDLTNLNDNKIRELCAQLCR